MYTNTFIIVGKLSYLTTIQRNFVLSNTGTCHFKIVCILWTVFLKLLSPRQIWDLSSFSSSPCYSSFLNRESFILQSEKSLRIFSKAARSNRLSESFWRSCKALISSFCESRNRRWGCGRGRVWKILRALPSELLLWSFFLSAQQSKCKTSKVAIRVLRPQPQLAPEDEAAGHDEGRNDNS